MQRVFVLSSDGQALDPCHPARARSLLRERHAAIARRYPFTIILKERVAVESVVHAHAVKIDPGSKTSGMAVVNETGVVVWAGEIEHRGQQIHDRLLARRQQRSSRRAHKTRYRPARFDNRRRAKGWLPPSLLSRVANIATWVSRLQRVAPMAWLSLELVKFDTQALIDPEISGAEYQQGTLYGYEVREYLLEKWGRQCAYCGDNNVPLQIEHLIPRIRGGTNRVDNLTLACGPCNQKKGNQTAAEFGYPHLHVQARQSLRDAAAVNATRWALYQRLCETGLPVECGTGGRTKFNRVSLGLPKAHWVDAACVGESGANVQIPPALSPLLIRATGHGSRQMCRMDRYGFPRTGAKGTRRVHGFRTGDMVRAIVPRGKRAGTHTGRVAVRSSGSFNVSAPSGTLQGIGWRYCQLLHCADGYAYSFESKGGGLSSSLRKQEVSMPFYR
ncbi:MAG: RNA-guided endonuclease IscB [Anaerolineales bacterium]